MRFSVQPGPRGNWRVMLEGADAPVSEHDTEEDAREALGKYVRGAAAAAAPTVETGIARGTRFALRDGTDVILRHVTADDKALLLEGFARLGDESRYQRFHGTKRRLSLAELAYFTEVDDERHVAIGAIDPVSGRGVGIARFVRQEDGEAEAAIVLADEWQHRGLGGVMMEALKREARAHGVYVFTASLLSDNTGMLELFRRLGDLTSRSTGGALEIKVALSEA